MMSGTESERFSTFGELLRHLRQRARLTQRQLGVAVGYSDAHITRLEAGQRQPDPSVVRARFIEALDLRNEPALAHRLIELAEVARAGLPDESGIAGSAAATFLAPDLPPIHRAGQWLAPLSSFVGREHEVADVVRLLPTTRLLTLTGSGGVGKTRLALEVGARAALEYEDGVWLAELAPLADADLVTDAVGAAVGLRSANRLSIGALAEYLLGRHLLLILDNCEHLIQACAELAEALLRACPRLRVLATSRERLNVPGEVAWRVPSLATEEAQALFVARARAVRAGFAPDGPNAPAVAAICTRLDGIPLAIELAAARLGGLSIAELDARLADSFRLLVGGSRTALPRQRTLRAAIDWSYDLLSEPERALLRRLSVFAGGWSLEAAEAVCGDDVSGEGLDVIDGLTRLVDKSLVVPEQRADGTARYHLLETIRQYAWEQLATCGEAEAVRRRHALYYLTLVQETAPPEMRRTQAPVQFGLMADSLPWLDRLDGERDNLRAALTWCLRESHDPRDVDVGVQLALWLDHFWSTRGPAPEGRAWAERALTHVDPTTQALTRARLLCALVLYEGFMGDGNLADMHAREALAICRALGDRYDLMIALWHYGEYSDVSVEESRAAIEEWLAIARELGEARYAGIALWYLGLSFHHPHSLAQAADLYAESLNVLPAHEEGARYVARYFQGTAAWELSGDEAGMAQVREGLAYFRDAGFELGITVALHWLGERALMQGHLAEARECLREALTVAYRDGAWRLFAACLDSLAVLAVAEGQPARGVTLWSAASGISGSLALSANQRHIDAARAQLDEQPLTAAEAAGRAMNHDQMMAYALQEDGADVPSLNRGEHSHSTT